MANEQLDNPQNDTSSGSLQQKSTVTNRLMKGVTTVVVIVVTLIGWAAIRASKGTFWLFSSKPDHMQTQYYTYTDPNQTFSVDFPSSLVVKQHIKNIPAEGGELVELKLYTAGPSKQSCGFSLSSYQWNITESPDQFAENRVRDVIVGMGGTLSSTEPIQRPGWTAIKGFGKGNKNGQPIQIMTEVCVKGTRVFALSVISTGNTVDLVDQPAVNRFFSTFTPLN